MNTEEFDLMSFIQNLITFLASEDSYVDKLPRRNSNVTTGSISSLDYKARAHGRLLEITNNISKTIVESCTGIDEICNKVRECLNDAVEMGIYDPKYSAPVPVNPGTLFEPIEIAENELQELKQTDSITFFKLKASSKQNFKYQKNKDLPSFMTMLNSSGPPKVLRMNIGRLEDRSDTEMNKSDYTNTMVDESIQNDEKEIDGVEKSHTRNKYDANNDYEHQEINEVNDIIQKDIEELRREVTKYKANKKIISKGKVEEYHDDIEEVTKESFSMTETEMTQKAMCLSTIHELTSECKGTQTAHLSNNSNVVYNIFNNASSEFEVDPNWIRLADFNKDIENVIPDVYRKPAFTDLFEKLLMQLEMNDSYVCFQKLMNPPNKTKNHRTPQNRSLSSTENKEAKMTSDMKNNFNNSLWFSRRYLVREKKSAYKKRDMRKGIFEIKKMKTGSTDGNKKSSLISLTNYSTTSSKCSMSSSIRKKQTMNSRNSTGTLPQMYHPESKYKVKVSNEMPMTNAEKRRLQWIRAKSLQAPVRKLECFDVLDDLTIRDLKPIVSEYPRKDRDTHFAKDCYLSKLLQDSNQETWQHLLELNAPNYEGQYDLPVKDINREPTLKDRIYSREDAIKILQPYLFDPIHCGSSVVTVLPVHVYYDNFDVQKPFRVQPNSKKNTKIPMEECKNVHNAKWILPENIKKNPPIRFKRPLDKSECQKMETEIEEQFKQRADTNMTKSQRNIWARKYTKSVGKQLIDFIDHQPELPPQPTPKYMIPITTKVEPTKKCPQVQNRSANSQKIVLTHLKDLRNKNHVIENNIENTINKIENKMLNIINEPCTKDNIHTFNSMEKEISNVLTMMKRSPSCNNRDIPVSSPKVTTPNKLKTMRDDLDTISDELFRKLEKILDDAGTSSCESQTSINSRHKNVHFKKGKDHTGVSNISNPNNEVKTKLSSKTKICLPNLTTRTGDELKEKMKQNNLVKPYGDQNILHSSELLVVTQKSNLPGEQQSLPNSCGDHCENVTPDKEKNKDARPKSENIERKQPEEIRSNTVVDDLTMKKIEFQRHLLAVETLAQIVKTDDGFDSEEMKMDEHTETKESEDALILTRSEVAPKSDFGLETENHETAKDFPEKVNKIIKRVEDIYTQLEDIHNIDYLEDIPKFHDNQEIISITSEEFLTPFMKDLKNKRKCTAPSQAEGFAENSSCTNVMNFLEKINTAENVAEEIHFARLCPVPLVTETANIKYSANLEQTLILDDVDKPSCLKKTDEYKIKKKVSFLVEEKEKEEKGNQVEICPHNWIKLVKTSSHQFPPLEESQAYGDLHDDLNINLSNNTPLHVNDSVSNSNISNKTSIEETILHDDKTDKVCQTQQVESDWQNSEETDVINEYSEVSETRSESLSQSKSFNNPFVFSEPQITIYCDDYNEKIPQVVVKSILAPLNSNNKAEINSSCPKKSLENKSKITLFREISNIAEMLSPFKTIDNFCSSKPNNCKLEEHSVAGVIKSFRTYSEKDENTIILLKSLYAVVYILMFTALNLEYMCVHG